MIHRINKISLFKKKCLFLFLFATTGIGNGSTFRMIGAIFDSDQRVPILDRAEVAAAYGVFLIPLIFQHKSRQELCNASSMALPATA